MTSIILLIYLLALVVYLWTLNKVLESADDVSVEWKNRIFGSFKISKGKRRETK